MRNARAEQYTTKYVYFASRLILDANEISPNEADLQVWVSDTPQLGLSSSFTKW